MKTTQRYALQWRADGEWLENFGLINYDTAADWTRDKTKRLVVDRQKAFKLRSHWQAFAGNPNPVKVVRVKA